MDRKELKKQILSKTNGHCAYCGRQLYRSQWHIEHMNPLGGNRIENLIASCPRCNLRKQQFTPERFKDYLRENMKKRLFKNIEYLNEFCRYAPLDGEVVMSRWLDLIDAIEDTDIVFYFETLSGDKAPGYY